MVLLIYTHLFLHLEHHLLLKQFGFKVEILEKVGCSLHHKRELRGRLGNFKKGVLHFHDSVKKITEIKFKRFFDKHILRHGDEVVISANPLELSLFNKTSFLHVALKKLQRQPSVLFCLLSQSTGTLHWQVYGEALGWWKGECAGEGEGCGPRRDPETNDRDPFSCKRCGAMMSRVD